MFSVKIGSITSTIIRKTSTLQSLRGAHTSKHLNTSYEYIKAEVQDNGVGLITLNRPKSLNAICEGLMSDLVHAANCFDHDDNVGAIVITGSEKAFAAGADIKEMATKTYIEAYTSNFTASWSELSKVTENIEWCVSSCIVIVIVLQ